MKFHFLLTGVIKTVKRQELISCSALSEMEGIIPYLPDLLGSIQYLSDKF